MKRAQGPQRLRYFDEAIEVRGAPAEHLQVAVTQWGPVVGKDWEGHPYALQWAAHDPSATNLKLIELEHIRSVAGCRAGGGGIRHPRAKSARCRRCGPHRLDDCRTLARAHGRCRAGPAATVDRRRGRLGRSGGPRKTAPRDRSRRRIPVVRQRASHRRRGGGFDRRRRHGSRGARRADSCRSQERAPALHAGGEPGGAVG